MKTEFTPPNQLTFLRILLTPIFVAFLVSADPLLRQLSIAVFVLAMLTDWYDGWVARRWGYITRWGTFLDPLADKVLTSAALIAFIYLDLVPAWTVWAIVIRDIAITFLRSYSELKGKPFDTSRMAKTKTFLQFALIYYVLLAYVGRETESLRIRYSSLFDQHLDPDAELRKELGRKCRSRILARFDAGAVVRTALRVAEIALAANDRMTLLRNLVEEEGLSTAR